MLVSRRRVVLLGRADDDPVREVVEPAAFPVALPGGEDQVRSRGSPEVRKRCSSAAAKYSGNPMPTKPPVATVSPYRIVATASSTPIRRIRGRASASPSRCG